MVRLRTSGDDAKLPVDKAEDVMVVRMPTGMRKFRDPQNPRKNSEKFEKPWTEDHESTDSTLRAVCVRIRDALLTFFG